MYLEGFDDLHEYLSRVAADLKDRGARELSECVEKASGLVVGVKIGLTTEFVGEARIALRRVLREGTEYLTPDEAANMEDVVRQLTASVNKWPIKPR